MPRPRSLGCLSLLLAALFVPSGPALAGVGIWTSLGPEGGEISALAVDPADPDVVYAGTHGSGAFKSTDGGDTWTAIGLGFTPIAGFAMDPRHAGTVYALSLHGGIEKSTDGGGSWTAVWGGPGFAGETDPQPALALDPHAGVLYVSTIAGTFRSTDGGATLEPLPGLGNGLLCLDAAGTLYTNIGSNLFKSTDQGSTWTPVGTDGRPSRLSLTALAVDPERPWILLAGTTRGLYRSTDGGRSWQFVGGARQQVSTVIFQKGRRAYVAYAGDPSLLRSIDGGASWQPAGRWSGGRVAALAATPGRVYAGLLEASSLETPVGLFRSLDAGATWERAERGLKGLAVTSVAVDPVDPRTLYAVSRVDLFKSTDRGASWKRLDYGLSIHADVAGQVLIDPARPATLWFLSGRLLLRSDDAGETWRSLSGTAGPSLHSLAIDPRAAGALWAPGREGVYHSDDGGLTWQFQSIDPATSSPLAHTELFHLQVDPRDPSVIYVAGTRAEGEWWYLDPKPRLFRSADGGKTWESRDQGISAGEPPGLRYTGGIEDMAVDAAAPDTVYALTPSFLYRSTDAGLSWQQMPRSYRIAFSRLVTAPAGSQTLPALYGVRQSPFPAVLRSLDRGETWTPLRRGLGRNSPSVLVIDPTDPAHLLLGTSHGGLLDYTLPGSG